VNCFAYSAAEQKRASSFAHVVSSTLDFIALLVDRRRCMLDSGNMSDDDDDDNNNNNNNT
jgi:hypothetical protein